MKKPHHEYCEGARKVYDTRTEICCSNMRVHERSNPWGLERQCCGHAVHHPEEQSCFQDRVFPIPSESAERFVNNFQLFFFNRSCCYFYKWHCKYKITLLRSFLLFIDKVCLSKGSKNKVIEIRIFNQHCESFLFVSFLLLFFFLQMSEYICHWKIPFTNIIIF